MAESSFQDLRSVSRWGFLRRWLFCAREMHRFQPEPSEGYLYCADCGEWFW